MERTFNDHNCKISSILKSVNLDHLHTKFVRKCVTIDTFLNLTEEDLDYLEITDAAERRIILNDFHLYHEHFRDILAPSKFDGRRMVESSMKQLSAINSLVSTMLTEVRRLEATAAGESDGGGGGCLDRLVDDVTPVSQIVDLLASQLLSSLDLIHHDLTQCEGGGGSGWRKWLTGSCVGQGAVVGCLTLCVPLVGILLWNQMKPLLLLPHPPPT